MRVLTGPRWRLGAADVTALWRRAVELDDAGRTADRASAAAIVAAGRAGRRRRMPGRRDRPPWPGGPVFARGSPPHRGAGRELTALRAQLHHPLPDLVAEVDERSASTPKSCGADVSAGWAGTSISMRSPTWSPASPRAPVPVPACSLPGRRDGGENGLAPAEITVAHDRVQILTVHAAKGLEWQFVAVPHLSGRVFPSTASPRTWLSDPADLPPLLRGDRATASEHGVPVLDTSDVNDRKALSDKITEHKRRLDQRRVDEERRLLYVALTRAEDTLLLSGHHWGATELKPRGPSEFLVEVRDVIERSAADGDPCGVIDAWAPDPAEGDRNPLQENVVQRSWPTDPSAPLGWTWTGVPRW